MKERGLKVEELARIAGVGRQAISTLRSEDWKKADRYALEKICAALRLELTDLLVLVDNDIWRPIKLSGHTYLHYGSRPVDEPCCDAHHDDTGRVVFQSTGVWDIRASTWIAEHVLHNGHAVCLRPKEHATWRERGCDPDLSADASEMYEGGLGGHGANHVVIGSQTAIDLTEHTVCYAFRVPPYSPKLRESFPYNFVWDGRRSVTSSFGWQGVGKEFGIWSTRTRKLVARRTLVLEGEGEDCGLILTYRVFVPPARRPYDGDERVIIALLGHSGPGTLAAARVATDPKYADALYPPERGVPLMRVVGAKYRRPPTKGLEDTRVLTEAYLIDDGPLPPARRGNRGERVGKPPRRRPSREGAVVASTPVA